MNKIHLKSPAGWINDPNGFIYYKGKYHLFYQHFPFAPVWGRMHWGHAVSDDLTNWIHKETALFPSKTDDRSGCFSGSAVEYNGCLHIFYTGVNYTAENPENINCMLGDGFSAAQMKIISEDGETFDNFRDKKTVIPVINDETAGSAVNTRDPKVWRGRDAWYMILGSSVSGKGRFLFYRSTDLENWEYVNFYEKENLGWMWECPDYFETGDNGVLIFSPIGSQYAGGRYDSASVCVSASFDEEKCELQTSGDYQFFDCGLDLYAPQSNTDADGNRVVMSWLRMPESADGKTSGVFAVPRICEVKNGHIFFRPHDNILKQFSERVSEPDFSGGAYLIRISLNENDSINTGGFVTGRRNGRIYTDRSGVIRNHTDMNLLNETPEIKEANLTIIIDENIAEVFVNDGEYVITNVVYDLDDSFDVCSDNKYEILGTK